MRKRDAPLALTESDIHAPPPSGATPPSPDLKALSTEVEQVANYVFRLRREIAALRPGSMAQDEVPSIRDDLSNVESEMRASTNRIMVAAEAMINAAPSLPEGLRGDFDGRLTSILEACSFHDLAGQRLARVSGRLADLEKRIDRFIRTVNVPDAEQVFDRAAIVRAVRREVLLVEGPQHMGEAIDQDAVDKLFG